MSLSFEELNSKATNVNNKINKFQTLLEANEKRIDELLKKAKEDYDVDDLDGLRTLLIAMMAEDEEELKSAAEKIEAAEIVLNEIENGLKELNV